MEQPKSWFLDKTQTAFNDNITIGSELVPVDITVREYLETSVRNAPRLLTAAEPFMRTIEALKG